MKFSSIKILILSSVFWVDCSFADPTPWWEVSYNLDIQYPTMGDYAWEYNSEKIILKGKGCLLYTSPSPRDGLLSRMPSSA